MSPAGSAIDACWVFENTDLDKSWIYSIELDPWSVEDQEDSLRCDANLIF